MSDKSELIEGLGWQEMPSVGDLVIAVVDCGDHEPDEDRYMVIPAQYDGGGQFTGFFGGAFPCEEIAGEVIKWQHLPAYKP
jgi:hypothetical protein